MLTGFIKSQIKFALELKPVGRRGHAREQVVLVGCAEPLSRPRVLRRGCERLAQRLSLSAAEGPPSTAAGEEVAPVGQWGA